MCILQLVIVGSYLIATTIGYCYRKCISKRFKIISGHPLNEYEEECAICFEKMENEDILIYIHRCKHVYHLACMKTWNNEYKQTCPTCRGDVGVIL